MCCWSEEMYSSVIMEMDKHEREQTKRVSWKMINAIKAAFRDVSFSQPTYNQHFKISFMCTEEHNRRQSSPIIWADNSMLA